MVDRENTSPVWHPFTQHGLGQPVVEIAHAEGAWLTTAAGARIIDAISSWWVITHGHRNPAIMAAIAEQAQSLDQVIFAGFTHEPAEQLARELISLAPTGLAHVFYSDSGSTAVEVALKMALGYWRNVGEPRTRIVALEHAYHGDTVGAMSAGARGVFSDPYAALLFDVVRIPFPAVGREQATYDALDAACQAEPVAALIVEPLILGAGGMLMYPPDVLAVLHAICQSHDVLFIADEVMTGWGRTGTLFACEQARFTPDILCTAKGLTGGALPLAATLCVPEIFQAHVSADRARMFFHSSSFTANPLACAAALANVRVWRDGSGETDRSLIPSDSCVDPGLRRDDVSKPRCVDRLAALTSLQREQLARFESDPRFANTRQCGTITALDLVVDGGGARGYMADIAPKLASFFIERGVLLRPLGNTIYVMPPYCITSVELALVYDAIAAAADHFARRP